MSEVTGMWRSTAGQGDSSAQCNPGVICSEGRGLKQDFVEAARLYREAADQAHTTAQFGLGFMYDQGHGTKQDFGEAARLYRKAADQGDADAQHNPGSTYSTPLVQVRSRTWVRPCGRSGRQPIEGTPTPS